MAFTSKTPLDILKSETSNVPPPKSKTNTFLSELFSKPYARAAAVGSFKILSTLIPAKRAASFVACLCDSLK